MNLTEYAADAILDGTPMPATLWVQLHTGNPGAAGVNNISLTTDRESFTRNAAAAGSADSVALIYWDASVGTESITHLSLWDAASAGNPWWVGPVTGGSVTVSAGAPIQFPIGTLVLSMEYWGA